MTREQSSVVKLGHPVLRVKCAAVHDLARAQEIAHRLWTTLERILSLAPFPNGIGLAAPQIGEPYRIFVTYRNGIRRTFINPELLEASPQLVPVEESCLSCFDFCGVVQRNKRIKISGLDLDGWRFEIKAEDDEASLYLHELDHLDGILYFDRLPNGQEDLVWLPGKPMIP